MQEIDTKAKNKKLAGIKSAMKQLDKMSKKKGVVQILGEKPETKIDSIPTGILTLDSALGVGGVPRGRCIELFGYESSGKSLIAQKVIAECQKLGGYAALVDLEYTFDPTFARKLGVNTDELLLSQPDHLQEAFTVIDALIDAGVELIVLDSTAALVPKEELEAEVGKQTMGLVARYMSQFLRRITGKLSKSNSTLIFINQMRDKIGVMFGDPTTTPGGKLIA